MSTPFSFSEAMAKPIQKIRSSTHGESLFGLGKNYLEKDSKIVFVCGANSTADHVSNREKFISYANKHLGEFRFFRAEDVFGAFSTDTIPDLLSVEDNLGKYSDCILILCESESAFAELGAFALSDSLVRQLLIVNDRNFKGSLSFINQGPIAKADKKSKFAPAVFADFESILRSIPEIESRLDKIPHQRRKKIDFASPPIFRDLSSKLRLLLLADFITLFSPITQKELIEILLIVFPTEDSFELGVELALGESLQFFTKWKLDKESTFFVASRKELVRFVAFSDLSRPAVRAEILRVYFKRDRRRLEVLNLGEKSHE